MRRKDPIGWPASSPDGVGTVTIALAGRDGTEGKIMATGLTLEPFDVVGDGARGCL